MQLRTVGVFKERGSVVFEGTRLVFRDEKKDHDQISIIEVLKKLCQSKTVVLKIALVGEYSLFSILLFISCVML